MKKVFTLFFENIKSTFDWRLYSAVIVLLAAMIGFNYSPLFERTFEKDWLRSFGEFSLSINYIMSNPFEWIISVFTSQIAVFFVSMYLPYVTVCGFIHLFTKQKEFFQKKGFWWSSIVIIGIIAFYRGAWFEEYAYDLHGANNRYILTYNYKLIENIENLATAIFPLFFLYLFYDRKRIEHFYGLQTKGVEIKPYLWMLLIMTVLIGVASLTSSFQATYPKVESSYYVQYASFSGYNSWQTLVLFEFIYLLGFISVELLFRGALIYSIEKYLGEYVILPMAVIYCVLHFGKPMGETISSFGGGYVLGVLALKTKNIYGGIFIHIGIALLMEVCAFIAKHYNIVL